MVNIGKLENWFPRYMLIMPYIINLFWNSSFLCYKRKGHTWPRVNLTTKGFWSNWLQKPQSDSVLSSPFPAPALVARVQESPTFGQHFDEFYSPSGDLPQCEPQEARHHYVTAKLWRLNMVKPHSTMLDPESSRIEIAKSPRSQSPHNDAFRSFSAWVQPPWNMDDHDQHGPTNRPTHTLPRCEAQSASEARH